MDIARIWLDDCLTNHKCLPLIDGSNDPTMAKPFLGSLLQAGHDEPREHVSPAQESSISTSSTTHQFKNTSSCPTRLIDTGDSISQPPRLVSTQKFVQTPAYMTLSHCWGRQHLFVLTQSNKNDLEREIPVQKLSKTFQDAFHITRQLGHRYLWIDSLCIIQNDNADWETESSKMATVYSNSVLNIAATHASDGSQGCFIDRQGRLIDGCYFPESLIRENAPTDSLYCCVDSELLSREIERAPLNSRAWVLQERLLPPRTLHFGKTQIHWSCHQGTRSESYPDRLEPHGSSWGSFWLKAVLTYTGTSLTRPSDKLVAISGLARLQQAFMPGEYVAGLWKRDLISQMCWFIPERSRHDRPTSYRAPSWSWAAVDGQIWWVYSPLAEYLCSFSDAHIDVASDDPFGQVQGGYIRVRGSLLVLPPSSIDETRPHLNTFCRGRSGESAEMGFYADTKDYWPKDEILYLCVLSRVHSNKGWGALVLKPTGEQKGQLQRVGFMQSWDCEHLEILRAVFDEDVDSSVFEKRDSVDKYGLPQYIFTIV